MNKDDVLKLVHLDPFEEDYRNYADHIISFNGVVRELVSEKLSDLFYDVDQGISIVTTGSDARLEKGPVSPIEFILLSNPLIDEDELRDRFEASALMNCDILPVERLESKVVGRDELSYVYFGEERNSQRLLSPNRFIDSVQLYGDEDLYSFAKKQFAEEITSEGLGRSIFLKIKDKLRDHKKITKTGRQKYHGNTITQFDIEEGVAFYKPEKGYWSFKQGPLRAVQYALVRDGIASMRSGIDSSEVLDLPANTVKKLRALQVKGHTNSNDSVNELVDHYRFFLHLYHQSQSLYAGEHSNTTLPFDKADVKDRLYRINELISEPVFKAK